MKTILILFFLLFVSSYGYSQTIDTSKTVRREIPVEFEVMEKGISCGITERTQEIIGDTDSYGDLLNDMFKGQREKISGSKKVDFATETVIGVFYGVHKTGGTDISVNQVTDDGSGNLIVYFTEITPGKSCVVSQTTTAPYQLIKVKKKVEQANFKVRRVETKCKQ